MSATYSMLHPGPIPPSFVADILGQHATQTSIGGYSLFLGQARADKRHDKRVIALEFTAHETMSRRTIQEIQDNLLAKYPLTCIHCYHAIGQVPVGGLCFFVLTAAAHRKAAIAACQELVERFKKEVPLFGKEILTDQQYLWKENQW